MSKKFVEALKAEDNFTRTENGAIALKSTYSSLVDLFSCIGALRNRSNQDIESLFIKAFAEDKLLATKMTYYARNVRGGLGERRVFRVVMGFLAKLYPDIVSKNLKYIPVFGREDDIFSLFDTECENDALEYIKNKLEQDCKIIGYTIPWRKS